MSAKAGLSTETIDKLCGLLELQLMAVKKKPANGKGR